MPPQEFAFQNSFKIEILSETYKTLNKSIIEASIPGITIGSVEQPTSIKPIFHPSDSIEFSTIDLTFVLDENYANWKLIFSWLNVLSNFHAINNDYTKIVDIAIHILSNKFNNEFVIQLEDCFPISMTELPINSQVDDTEPMTFTVTFIVNNMTLD